MDAGRRAASGARIDARGLTRHFGGRVALHPLDLTIERGESFGLLGANGAGKTTFIRLVTGYLAPTAGRITVDGVEPARTGGALGRKIGFVSESSSLYPELHVEGFLRFAGSVHGLAGSELDAAVAATLDRFGLADVARRVIGNLSKGFQQRTSLAQAFLHDPALLIVDEPTSGLDPLQQDEVRGVLGELRGRRTLIVCTHDLEEARTLTDRAAVLHQGRLVADGPTPSVLDREDPLALFRGEMPEDSEDERAGALP